ncbi:MAG: PEP-CTERM sorting domain-containing protein [Pirellulales bacterium]|nr:PEP-CTERM sorting domain-containing protein [Pirellulales bacterium]
MDGKRDMQLRLVRHAPHAAAIICMLALIPGVASAATLTIDEFNTPAVADVQAIGILPGQPGPRLLVKQPAADVVGLERDSLFEVNGMVTPGVYTGFIGDGILYYNGGTRTGTKATLQYDGLDADDPGTPALVDAQGLSLNIGTVGKFIFGFLSADAGPSQNTFKIEIRAVSAGGKNASYLGDITEDPNPFDYQVDYSSFTTDAGFDFTQLKSLTVCLNKTALPAVDFELDRIEVSMVPEPSSLVLLICGGGMLGWYGLARRKRSNASLK